MIAHTSTNRNLSTLPAAPALRGPSDDVTIRRSAPGDGPAIARLARLDDSRLPAGPHLLAERGGRIVAAVSLMSGTAIADPFVRTAEVVALLQLRVRQLTAETA
jgi:hypothetical protein